jgi:hypothetical protein
VLEIFASDSSAIVGMAVILFTSVLKFTCLY